MDEVIGSTQCVKIPIKVETDFYKPSNYDNDEEGWEVQLFDNDCEDLIHELDGQNADFFILSVDMVSVVKPKKKKVRGRMRKVAVPVVGDDEEGDDTGMDG